MSDKVKKIVHPLLFASVISAVAAVVSDKYLNTNKDNLQEIFLLKSKPWEESLFTFTSPPHISQDMKAGDYFSLIIGPACVALAFRIFSQAEKLESKLPSILIATGVSAAASLAVSPLLGASVGIPSEINAALAHRSVASALAIPSSKIAGNDTNNGKSDNTNYVDKYIYFCYVDKYYYKQRRCQNFNKNLMPEIEQE
jgi:hypothetical protein